MDIKFLRPHELVVSVDTGPGGVQVVANGSEAKIADAMLRELHRQGVLADAGHDLRFSMRPGGDPGRGELGGVVEAFLTPGEGGVALVNRFGEPVVAQRAGRRASLARPLRHATLDPVWRWAGRRHASAGRRGAAGRPPAAGQGRFLGPDDPLPAAAAGLVCETLARLATLSHDDYRYLVEEALPGFAAVDGAGGATSRGSRRSRAVRMARAARAAKPPAPVPCACWPSCASGSPSATWAARRCRRSST